LPERENTVQQRAFKLKDALATVKMWDLQGYVQKVNRHIRLLLGIGRKEAENILNFKRSQAQMAYILSCHTTALL
jgi:hypothetical protein